MQLTQDDLARIGNGNVVTTAGDKIGGIGQVYVDDKTGEPAWVTVKTGLFGTSESFVPLSGANLSGGDIAVSFSKEQVKEAPRVEADGQISHDEEDQLFAYYGVGQSDGVDAAGAGVDTSVESEVTAPVSTDTARTDTARTDRSDEGTVGHDTSGPTTDDAMTLSEEQLRVGTQTRESGRARLRKYVTTETVSQTVPVSHEEVRIEREPITDANVGAATSGPSISEEEHEVVLHEEVPVVAKEAVPVERVKLNTETVTEQATVSEEVRKEQLDTDIDGQGTDRR